MMCPHDAMVPGTIVAVAFPGGWLTMGACAHGCGDGIESVTLGEHPGLRGDDGFAPTERALAVAMLRSPAGEFPHVTPLEVIDRDGLDECAAWVVLQGWSCRGWLDCGVSPRTGWLTEEGRAALGAMVDAMEVAR